jgi:hypothetical protein
MARQMKLKRKIFSNFRESDMVETKAQPKGTAMHLPANMSANSGDTCCQVSLKRFVERNLRSLAEGNTTTAVCQIKEEIQVHNSIICKMSNLTFTSTRV